ncbi:DUF4421 family protein [Aquimarina sediminis]|uniref:DUF4421 family protein n=1 Tax=Aquimarina sediminis TaxID=2070536 RepID=UPI000CA03EF9|nr:DUF4421 family protein [Aquimarina sediminis]
MKTILLLAIILCLEPIFGQNKKEQDSTGILSFVDKMVTKVNIDTQSESFSIIRGATDEFKIRTNNQYKLSLSLDYEFLGISIGFAPKFLPDNNDDGLRGKSSFTDYKFRFFFGNWTQSVQYTKNQGFYVENTVDFVPNWIRGQDAYIQFPNLKTIFWGGSTSYVLNPKFSLRNVTYNTEWQRKSAGSLIPTLHYGYNRKSNTTNGEKTFENNYDVRLAADYYYTWVIYKNWFAAPYISPSLGIRYTSYNVGTNIEKFTALTTFLNSGLQVGYSSRKIVFGANFNFNKSWIKEDEKTTVNNNKVFAKVYFGYRFEPPKFVRKTFKAINHKLGL